MFNYPKEYIVDINNPPIFPPGRLFENCWFYEIETKESINQAKMWDEYILKYAEESLKNQ